MYANMEELLKPVQHVGPESDIINNIISIWQQLNLTLRSSRVYSYQAKYVGPKQLEVQLKEGCDKCAGEFSLIDNPNWHSQPSVLIPPTVAATPFIKHVIITDNMKLRFEDFWTSIRM